jgi:tetratricopeptide (TPR) repeat protein
MILHRRDTRFYKLATYCIALCIVFCISCTSQPGVGEQQKNNNLIFQRYRNIKYTDGDRAALNYTDSLLKNSHWNDKMLFELYKIEFGIYLFSYQRYDSSMIYADSMMAILERNPNMPDYANLLAQTRSAKGDAYYYSGRFREAFNWYDLNSYSDVEGATPAFNAAHNFRIAMTMYRTERFAQAARYFKRSFVLYDSSGASNMEEYYRVQQVLNDIGLSYYKAGNYDSALVYYTTTLQYIHRHEKAYSNKRKMWDYAAAVVYDNLGSLYTNTNRPDSALHAFKTSLALSKEYPRDHFHIHTKLAKLYTGQHQYDMAKAELDSANKILEEGSLQEPNYMYDYQQAAWLYYNNTGNYQKASLHLHAYQQLKDTFFVKQKDALIEELYSLGEKEAKQRAEIVRKNEKLRTQTKLTLLFICISALLAGGGLVRLLMKQNRKFSNYRLARAEQERRLKEELLQKERHLLSIMNNTDDLVWAVDSYFKLTTFNKAYDELIYNISDRYPEVGKPSTIAAADPAMYDKWIGWHKRAMAGEAFTVIDNVRGLKPGKTDIEARFWPLHDSDNNIIGIGCLVRNITEYMENTRKIATQNTALKEIAHMQSHDVRGPVATMKGLLQLINSKDLAAAENQELIQLLEAQLNELDNIIHAISNKATRL